MENLTAITGDIFRLVIPFKDIYTTVFLIRTPEGTVLLDTATYPEDVDTYILPALQALELAPPAWVVLSHSHGDHAGGLARLLEVYPEACVLSRNPGMREIHPMAKLCFPEDGFQLLPQLKILAVPGHAADCLALLDLRTNTLLTGDSLQLYGIYGSGTWGASIRLPAEHLRAISRLRQQEIHRIVAAHDYHPMGYLAEGSESVKACLDACRSALYKILEAIRENPELTDAALSAQYNAHSGLPTVGSHIFAAIHAAAEAGEM